MVPCFALMASIGLWVERDFASDIETQDLAQHVGSLAGKIAISMNRHDAANQPQLAQDLHVQFAGRTKGRRSLR